MSAPYRSEDPVAKLQAENEKLREENDKLMWRFSSLRKWPRVLFFACCYAAAVILGVRIGTTSSTPTARVALDEGQMADISDRIAWHASRAVGEHRQEFAREVARDLDSRINLQAGAQTPSSPRACPALPVCANGVDERVLGMNKVVSGTIGGPETGPLNEDWKFSARAGDEVIFRMKKKSGGLDPFLILADAQGNILASDDNAGLTFDATLHHRFAFSGIYILRCMDNARGDRQEGSYTLSATRVRTR